MPTSQDLHVTCPYISLRLGFSGTPEPWAVGIFSSEGGSEDIGRVVHSAAFKGIHFSAEAVGMLPKLPSILTSKLAKPFIRNLLINC